MAIFVGCSCGRQFQTEDQNAGRRAACPGCGRPLLVPRPATPTVLTTEPQQSIPTVLSRTAVASALLGGLSLLLLFFAGLPAILLGSRAFREINRGRGLVSGRPIALLGIVLGVFGSTAMPLAYLTPAFRAAREAGYRAQCTNNMKTIGLALHNFHNEYGRLPPGAIFDRQGKALLSWRVAILPFLGPDEAELFKQFHLDEPWDSPHNYSLLNKMPAVLACPSASGSGQKLTPYQVLIGPKTLFTGQKRGIALSAAFDGTSNTLMVVEGEVPVRWTEPMELPFNGPGASLLSDAGSSHPGGFHVLMGDGSVHFLQDWISPTLFNGLATRNGAELVSPP